MKLQEAIDLYKQFCNTMYTNGTSISECIVIYNSDEMELKLKTRLPCIYWTGAGRDLIFDKFSLAELASDKWEICIFRDVSMASGTSKPMRYRLKTESVKRYLERIHEAERRN